MFIPKASAKSVAADFAPISASIIFFSLATVIVVKAIQGNKNQEPKGEAASDRSTQESTLTQEKFYDPDPLLMRAWN